MKTIDSVHRIVGRAILALMIVCAISPVIDNSSISFLLLFLIYVTGLVMCHIENSKEE